MSAIDHTMLYGAYNVSEQPRDLAATFHYLAERGLSPKFATVDGNPALSQALRQQWPQIVLQRCLVHIQRQGLSWCRRTPKRTDAKHLRKIFLDVMSIHSLSDQTKFLRHVQIWEQTYGVHIAASPQHGYVFGDLKKARRMLLTALPNMFHYLNDPLIANSTNALEGYFSRLKQRYRQHRGLAQRHRLSYFQWYLSLCIR
jgi:transposase-like protein